MKKSLIFLIISILSIFPAFGQEDAEDRMIFNHWGVGVSVGTTALGFTVSSMVTPYVGIRAGVNVWPAFHLRSNLHLRAEQKDRSVSSFMTHVGEINSALEEDQQIIPTMPDVIELKVKPQLTGGHLLVDFYPAPRKSNFHLTTGFHFGRNTVVDIHNRREGILMPVTLWNNAIQRPELQSLVEEYDLRRIGLAMGDYFLAPDEKGNIDARIKVHGFRSYLGFGFGRAVPRKRIGCQFDLGAQFWGHPKVEVNGVSLEPERAGEKGSDLLSFLSRITIYPVVRFRLVGRIF